MLSKKYHQWKFGSKIYDSQFVVPENSLFAASIKLIYNINRLNSYYTIKFQQALKETLQVFICACFLLFLLSLEEIL